MIVSEHKYFLKKQPNVKIPQWITLVTNIFQESEILVIYRKTASFVVGILPDNDNIKDYISETTLQSISEPSHTPSSNGNANIPKLTNHMNFSVSECMSGYLENQLNFAADFKNGKNYKKSLLKYVHHLVQSIPFRNSDLNTVKILWWNLKFWTWGFF